MAFCSVAIFLAASEVILRIVKVSPKPDNLYFLLNPELNYPEFFRRDHNLFWKFRPNQVIRSNFIVEGEYRINFFGLRNKEFSEKKPEGVLRIICLGNSNTFGWKQKEEDAYPQQLQKLFDANRPELKLEVINAGITGYSSYQGKIFLREKILKLQPDLVTVNYGWNDLLPAKFGIQDKEQKLPPQWVLDIQNLFSRTTLYQVLKSLWVGSFAKREGIKKGAARVSLPDFQQNLIEIERTCRENGVPVVFLTNPIASIEAFWGPGKTSKVHILNKAYNDAIIGLSDTHNFYVLDVTALFLHRADLYDNGKTDFIHYNALGHKLVAQILYEYLLANGLVPSSEKSANLKHLNPSIFLQELPETNQPVWWLTEAKQIIN